MSDQPFSDAVSVFDKVQDLVEAHAEAVSPGASGVCYTFGYMAGLPEHRHIAGSFTGAHGGTEQFVVLLPQTVWHAHAKAADIRLDLTGQEAELLTDLVWLGACAGFWYVENLADMRGEVKQRYYDYMRGGYQTPPPVDPIALLAAFAGGELEAMWPERKALFEKGWHVWQARHHATMREWEAQIVQQGGGRARELWSSEESSETPDYLR